MLAFHEHKIDKRFITPGVGRSRPSPGNFSVLSSKAIIFSGKVINDKTEIEMRKNILSVLILFKTESVSTAGAYSLLP